MEEEKHDHETNEHEHKEHEHKEHEHKEHDSTEHKVHEHKSAEAKIKVNPWQIATAVLAVLLIISVFTRGFMMGSSPTGGALLSKDAVSQKSVKYINENILQGQATATLKSTDESNGLYTMKLTINGQEFNTYATKDGQLLFPQAINLDEIPKKAAAQQQPPSNIEKKDKPEVLLFTMSYCPYGNQAESGIKPVVDALKDSVEIQPHYVIYSNYGGGGPKYCLDAENKYCSMHGIQELNQNVRELCAWKYQKDKYWDFVMAMNSKCSASNADTCWEQVAKDLSIDTEKIKTCEKTEAVDLLKTEVELNTKFGVQGSPTLFINGAEYSGGRTPEAYKTSICAGFTTEPGECQTTLDSGAASQAAAAAAGGCGV